MRKYFLTGCVILTSYKLQAFQSLGNNGETHLNNGGFLTSYNGVLAIAAMSFIAFCMAVFNTIKITRRRKHKLISEEDNRRVPNSLFPTADDSYVNKQLEAKYERLEVTVKDLKTQLSDFENKFKAFEDDSRIVELPIAIDDRFSHDKPPLNSEVQYAKFPDMYNGFSADALSSAQDGEKIYEITASGDIADFSVSADVDAQNYALSDYRYYLENGCDMLNTPEKNSRIITEKPGRLSKKGKDWIIGSKATIKFI